MSNTYPENNLGPLPLPTSSDILAPSTNIAITTGSHSLANDGTQLPANNGATWQDKTITGLCGVHKSPNNLNMFPPLNNVYPSQKIWAAEVNSLKYAIQVASWVWNLPGNGQVVNFYPSFASKTNQNKISAAEWNELKTTLSFASSGASLTNRQTGTLVTAQFHNDLNAVYNTLRSACRCNSDCACNMVCSCNYNCGCNYSDRRLKTNIIPITGESTSELIYDLNTYSYNYIYDREYQLPSTLQYGVIAQDLIELGYHEFISLDKTGHYKVNYTMMIPLVINEMQKMRRTNQELESRVENLEQLINTVHSKTMYAVDRITILEKQVDEINSNYKGF